MGPKRSCDKRDKGASGSKGIDCESMIADREVNINIKYLVNLSDKAGRRQETASFPEGSTLHDLARYLKEKRNIILPSPGVTTVLNGKGWDQYPDKWNTPVSNGDTVLLLPLLSGG